VNLRLVIDAVIAGSSPGSVWVDDADQPRAALLWDHAHCFYLTGIAHNPSFNRWIQRLLMEQIFPEARRLNVFKVYYSDPAWEEQIPAIFAPIPLEQWERVHYMLPTPSRLDWHDSIPAGFRVEAISETLLTRADLKHTDSVREEIESGWNSLAGFLQNGFGYCVLNDEGIVGWCTAEYVSRDQCGIGIETVEAYGRQGFATLTASAFVDHCAAHSIIPHWDSWKNNLPSVRVAEKLGFQKALDYSVFFGKFPV
jgi:RimJ/RimL family protein N-acetyltransferase